MKNAQIETPVADATVILAQGWTMADAVEAIEESTIDRCRFASPLDRTLSIFEGEEGLALFPSRDELAAAGVDVARVANALASDVSADLFARAVEMGVDAPTLVKAIGNGLDFSQFGDTLDGLPADEVNGALECFSEYAEDVALHPDLMDRVLHRHGECSCH